MPKGTPGDPTPGEAGKRRSAVIALTVALAFLLAWSASLWTDYRASLLYQVDVQNTGTVQLQVECGPDRADIAPGITWHRRCKGGETLRLTAAKQRREIPFTDPIPSGRLLNWEEITPAGRIGAVVEAP